MRTVSWLLTTWLAASACGGKAGQAEGAGSGGSGNQSSASGSGGTVGSEVSGGSGAVAGGGSGGSTSKGSSGNGAASGAGGSFGGATSSAGGAAPEGGAGNASSSGGASGAGGEETVLDFDYPIDPAALAGCRSPLEEGCAECCVGTTADGRCDYLAGIGAPADVPSYNERVVKEGPCPASCQPCAQCSLRSERDLRTFNVRPECNCTGFVEGTDPCFVQNSCACYCAQLNWAREPCPPAAG